MTVSMDDDYIEYVDEKDEQTGADYAGGGETVALSHPDQSPRMQMASDIALAVKEALDAERKTFFDIKHSAVRVTTNLSGEVVFARFDVVDTVPIQIVREKELRGDITIVNYSGTGYVYIGLHAGIRRSGTDTVAIAPNASRVIRTRRALWAITDVPASTIDVQEEFD